MNNLSDSVFSLSKLGLSNLQQEPQRLVAESTRLNGELEILVLENYRVFIENLTCSVTLRAEDRRLEEMRGHLKGDLKQMIETCKSFRDKVSATVNSYKRNRKTLQHHMQLVELLEVPQLVDACSRNGFYDEALELANFVNGLERRHLLASGMKFPPQETANGNTRHGGNVVQSIVDDVYHTLLGLRIQLLHILTDDSSLPQELQIIGTLRKLDTLLIDRKLSIERYSSDKLAAMSDESREKLRRHVLRAAETRLQMDFLEARSIWLKKSSEKIIRTLNTKKTDDKSTVNLETMNQLGPYGKAIEMLEINRTAWFAIITQYKALFVDQRESAHPSLEILGSWVTKQVEVVLSQLRKLLPLIEDGGSMRSVLEQALFFSSRMKDVSCDFSNYLFPIFSEAILGRITSEWRMAADQFKQIILTEKINIELEDFSREQMVPLLVSQDDSVEDTYSHLNRKTDDILAPQYLMCLPPLAYLLNSFLSGLNFLRECPLKSIRGSVVELIKAIVHDIVDFLISSVKAIASKGSKYISTIRSSKSFLGNNESSLEKILAEAFLRDLLTHFLHCVEALYPSLAKPEQVFSKITRASDARESLSRDLYDILESSWKRFESAGVIPRSIATVSTVKALDDKRFTVESSDAPTEEN